MFQGKSAINDHVQEQTVKSPEGKQRDQRELSRTVRAYRLDDVVSKPDAPWCWNMFPHLP